MIDYVHKKTLLIGLVNDCVALAEIAKLISRVNFQALLRYIEDKSRHFPPKESGIASLNYGN